MPNVPGELLHPAPSEVVGSGKNKPRFRQHSKTIQCTGHQLPRPSRHTRSDSDASPEFIDKILAESRGAKDNKDNKDIKDKTEKMEKNDKNEKVEKRELKEIKNEKLEREPVFEQGFQGPGPELQQVIQVLAGLTKQVNQLANQMEELRKKVEGKG